MKTIAGFLVAFLVGFVLITVPVCASDVSYKIRSTVYDNTDPSTPAGDFYWDASTFSGFWYPIKPGLSSEVLYFHNSVNSSSSIQLGDEIAEGDLYYVSKPQTKKTRIGGSADGSTYIVDNVDLKKYYLMGFFGSQYLVIPEDPSDLSAGCKPDNIAKILLETKSGFKKQMFAGEEWELSKGWSLTVQQVDVEGNKVWVRLNKDGEEVDSAVISGDPELSRPERTYLYKDDDDNPVFYCYVDSIFKGTTDDFVVFKYAFLRDEIKSIESGESYGLFDVEGFKVPSVMNGTDYAGSGSGTVLNTGDDALVMASNEDVTLGPDRVVDLYDGMYLKTEDTSGSCLKMTLWKKCTIAVQDIIVDEDTVEEKEEVVVVDLAEEDGTDSPESMASVVDEVEGSKETVNEDVEEVKSSVATPGFGLALCLLGLASSVIARRY